MAITQEVQILLKAVDGFTPTVKKINAAIVGLGGAFDGIKKNIAGVADLVARLESSLVGIGRAVAPALSSVQSQLDAIASSTEKAIAAPTNKALVNKASATANEQKAVGHGGDAVGHPFRGNQYTTVDASGLIVPRLVNKESTNSSSVIEHQTVVQQKVDRKDETHAEKNTAASVPTATQPTVPGQAAPAGFISKLLQHIPEQEGHASPGAPKVHDIPGASGVHALTEGFGELKEGVGASNEALEKLSNLIKVLGRGYLLLQGVKLFEEMAGEAAEVERLGTVVHMVGANAGYMASEVDAADKKVQSLGITASTSRTSLTEFIKSGLALEGAAKLARAAQDLAVISGENSSDTFRGLTEAISEQSIMMLRWRGISVTNEEAQQKFAAQQGRSVSSLTEVEKKQALLNLTLERAASLSGIYEAAMGDVGKQASSLARYQEEAAETLQHAMLPAYSQVVTELTIFLRNLRTLTEEYNAAHHGSTGFSDGVGLVARNIRKGLETLVSYRQEITTLAKAYIAFKAAQAGVSFFANAKDTAKKGFGNLAEGKSWGGKAKGELAHDKEQVATDEAKVKATTAHAAASTKAEIAITGEATATGRLAGAVNATAIAYERMAVSRAAALKNPLSMVAGEVQNTNKAALQTTPTGSVAQKTPVKVPTQPTVYPVDVAAKVKAVERPKQPVNIMSASVNAALNNPNGNLGYTQYNPAGKLVNDGGSFSGQRASAALGYRPRPVDNALSLVPVVASRSPTKAPTVTAEASGASNVANAASTIAPAVISATGAVGVLGKAFTVVGGIIKGIWSLLGGIPGIIIGLAGYWLVFGGGVEKIGKVFDVIAHTAMNIKDTIHSWFSGDNEKKEQLKNRIADRNKAYAESQKDEAHLELPESKEYSGLYKTKRDAEEKKIYLEYQQGKIVQQLKASYNVGDQEKSDELKEQIRTAKEEAKAANEALEKYEEENKDKLTPGVKKLITSKADKEAFQKGIENQNRLDVTDLQNTRKQTGQDQTIFNYGAPVSIGLMSNLKEARLEVDAFSKNMYGADASIQRVTQAYENFIDSAKTTGEIIVAQREWQKLIDENAAKLDVLTQLKGGASKEKAGASPKEAALFKATSESITDEANKSGETPDEIIAKRIKAAEALKSGFTDFGNPLKASQKREEELKASPEKAKAYYDELVKTGEISKEVATSFDGNLDGQIDLALGHAAGLTKEFERLGATVQSLSAEKAAFNAWELAIDELTKKTEYFAKQIAKVKELNDAQFQLETSALSGAEFKGDKTSTVMASINVEAERIKYERAMAYIKLTADKRKAVSTVSTQTGLDSDSTKKETTLANERETYEKSLKAYREEHKAEIEGTPEKAKDSHGTEGKKNSGFFNILVNGYNVKDDKVVAGVVEAKEKGKVEVPEAAKKPATPEVKAATAPTPPVATTTKKEGSGVEDVIRNTEEKKKALEERLVKEGKGRELEIYTAEQKLTELKKAKDKVLATESAKTKEDAETKVVEQEKKVAELKDALARDKKFASAAYVTNRLESLNAKPVSELTASEKEEKTQLTQANAKGVDTTGTKSLTLEGTSSDKAQLDKYNFVLENAEKQKKSEDKYKKEAATREDSASTNAKESKANLEEKAGISALALDADSAKDRLKVSQNYYDALRKQLDIYYAGYTAKVESMRDIHKGEIDLATTLVNQRHGDVIAGEQMKFNPLKENIYSAEAAQGQAKLGAEGAKYEENLSALKKSEDKQKEMVNKGDATPHDKQLQLNQIEAEGITKRLALNKDYFSQLNSLREDALAKAKQHAQAAVDFEKQARDTILEGNKTLREMNRTNMSAPDKYIDQKKEYAEAMSRGEEMRKAGDFKAAEKQFQSAQGMASGLLNSDAVDPLTAKREAMERHAAATQSLVGVQTEQGSIERAGEASQMATVQNVTETMSRLSESMHELATNAEVKLNPKLDEAAIADIQKQLNGVTADHTADIKVALNNESVDALYKSVQGALDNHTFSVNIEEANVKGSNSRSAKSTDESGDRIAKADGGLIQGVGTGTSDSIPALLSHGEFVVKRDATDHYGTEFLSLLNSRALRFSEGGVVEGKRKEGIAGWLFHQKYTAEDVENSKTVKKSILKESQHEDLLNRALSSETTRRAQIAQAAAYSNYSLGGLVSHFDSGGDSGELLPGQVMYKGKPTWASQVPSEPKKKEGFFGSLFSKVGSTDEKKPAVGSTHVEPAHAQGTVLGNKDELQKVANYAEGGDVKLEPGQVLYNGKAVWASQVPRDSNKKEGLFSRILNSLTPKESEPKSDDSGFLGGLLGKSLESDDRRMARTVAAANYADGGGVGDSASWGGETTRFNRLSSDEPKKSSTTTTSTTKTINSNTGRTKEADGHGILGSVARHLELKDIVKSGRALTNADLAAKDPSDKNVAAPSSSKGYSEVKASDNWFNALKSAHKRSEAEDIWNEYQTARIARSNHYDNFGSSHTTSSTGTRVTARDLGGLYASGGDVVNPTLVKYAGGGLVGFNTGTTPEKLAEAEKQRRLTAGQPASNPTATPAADPSGALLAIQLSKGWSNDLAAASAYGLEPLTPKSVTQTVSNASVVNTNKDEATVKRTPSVLGSAARHTSLVDAVKSGRALTSSDLADDASSGKMAAVASSSTGYNEVKASDQWFNKLKSNRKRSEAEEIWNDYQSARIQRSNHYDNFGSSHTTSSTGERVTARDLGGMYAEGGIVVPPMLSLMDRFAEGGIAQRTGEYWAHDNEEFEKSHPNPLQQLGRLLNPITGFGSALGTVHKAAGEGDLLGLGMGILGALPVFGSAVHGARGMKLTADLVKRASEHTLKDRTKEMVAENIKHQTHASLPIGDILERVKSVRGELPNLRNAPRAKRNYAQGDSNSLTDFISDSSNITKVLSSAYDKDKLKGTRYAQFAEGGDVVDRILTAFGLNGRLDRTAESVLGGKKKIYGDATSGIRGATGGMATPDGFINALVSHGEFRVNKDAVSHYGSGLFNAINDMSYSRFSDGGLAGAASDMLNAENLPNSGQTMTPSEMIELSVKIGEAKASKVQGSRDSIYNLVHSLRDLQDRSMT